MNRKIEEEQKLKEEKNRRAQESKNKKVHVAGIRPKFFRSNKPELERREEKKEVQSEQQIAIQRYLGMQLEDEEKKRQ